MKAFRLVVALFAFSASTSCMGGIEARMNVEAARAQSVADRCAQLTQSKTSIASPGGVFGAGTVDFRAELTTQLKGVLGGLGTLKQDLQKFGASAKLDAAERVRHELAALEEDITEPVEVTSGSINVPAGSQNPGQVPATVAGNGVNAAAPVSAQTAAGPQQDLARMPKKGAAELHKALDGLRTRVNVVVKDFDDAAAAAAALSSCVGGLNFDVSLDVGVQLDTAKVFANKMVTCGASKAQAFIAAVAALPNDGRSLEGALAEMRGTVDALKQSTDAASSAIGARAQLAIIEITALTRAQSRWLNEAIPLATLLERVASDPDVYARQFLTAMGERLLVRQAGGYAKAVFRLARISMRQVDRQLASVSSAGYGLGSITVMFAAGYVDAAVERAGKAAGRLTRKLGSGANAVLYEACSEMEENKDSDMSILGMAPFYAGFIRGFDDARTEQHKAKPQGGHVSLDPVWWRKQLDGTAFANTMPAGTAKRGPLDSLRASTEDVEKNLTDSFEGDLTPAEIDLLADWTALYASESAGAWGPPPAPADRRQARSSYVQTLLSYPGLFRTGGEDTTHSSAEPIGPKEPATTGTTNGPVTTYLDQRLMYLFVGVSPEGGAAGGEKRIDEHNVTVDVSALKTNMERLNTAHLDLIRELERRETHWLATQFVASICQSIGGSAISRSTGVWCAPRQAEDSVSTLTLETPSFPNGEWDLPTRRRAAFYATVRDTCAKPPNGENRSLSKACSQARTWSTNTGWKLSTADAASFDLIVQGTALLAGQIRSHASQMLGDQESKDVRVVVTGMASALGFNCDQLRFRLLTSTANTKPRGLHACAGKAYGTAGVDLCFEATATEPSLVLRSGEHHWECKSEPEDDADESGKDSVTSTTSVKDRKDNANELLAVLRGWSIRRMLEKEMKGSPFVSNLLFEMDPPPALGGNCRFGQDGCSKFKVAEVQVRVWASRAEAQGTP